MPYGNQDDADDLDEREHSALWPSAADGSSGLRDRRGPGWVLERVDPERRLGPYELLSPIGTTAYGRAFRARHVAQGREVALHFLGSEQGPVALARDLPLAVAKCAQLSHPNVIAIEEYGQRDDGTYYLATEPLDGVSLADCLDDVCTLPLSRALSIAVQVGRALRAAHKLGIVHGALTPANVRLVMTEQGELARVVGFGSGLFWLQDPSPGRGAADEPRAQRGAKSARARESSTDPGRGEVGAPARAEHEARARPEHEARARPEHETRARPVFETRAQPRPAQAAHAFASTVDETRAWPREADVRGDVYAVGALLFRMLAGRPPPPADGTPPSLSAWSAEPVPRALEELVARCLEPRPEARLADLVVLTRELREIARRVDAGLRRESDEPIPHEEPAPVREQFVPSSDSDPGGLVSAESVIRHSGVAWIVLGLLLALAAVWSVWHASGRGAIRSEPVRPRAGTER